MCWAVLWLDVFRLFAECRLWGFRVSILAGLAQLAQGPTGMGEWVAIYSAFLWAADREPINIYIDNQLIHTPKKTYYTLHICIFESLVHTPNTQNNSPMMTFNETLIGLDPPVMAAPCCYPSPVWPGLFCQGWSDVVWQISEAKRSDALKMQKKGATKMLWHHGNNNMSQSEMGDAQSWRKLTAVFCAFLALAAASKSWIRSGPIHEIWTKIRWTKCIMYYDVLRWQQIWVKTDGQHKHPWTKTQFPDSPYKQIWIVFSHPFNIQNTGAAAPLLPQLQELQPVLSASSLAAFPAISEAPGGYRQVAALLPTSVAGVKPGFKFPTTKTFPAPLFQSRLRMALATSRRSST